jgi:hypothetical protein
MLIVSKRNEDMYDASGVLRDDGGSDQEERTEVDNG